MKNSLKKKNSVMIMSMIGRNPPKGASGPTGNRRNSNFNMTKS